MAIINAFTSIWQAMLNWLTGAFGDVTSLFYSGDSLTFIGTLGAVMAGIALVLLAFNLIRSFLTMRG